MFLECQVGLIAGMWESTAVSQSNKHIELANLKAKHDVTEKLRLMITIN